MFVLPKLRKAFTPAGLPLNAISINNLPISQESFFKNILKLSLTRIDTWYGE